MSQHYVMEYSIFNQNCDTVKVLCHDALLNSFKSEIGSEYVELLSITGFVWIKMDCSLSQI